MNWLPTVGAIVAAAFGSTGLWQLIQRKLDKKDVRTRMLLGLGHDRIINLCMKYIDRGYITRSEFENLYKYLYKPYEDMGGNGTAKRLMEEVRKLPVKKDGYKPQGRV